MGAKISGKYPEIDPGAFVAHWSAVVDRQNWRTAHLYECYIAEGWFRAAMLNKPHLNRTFPQRLSRTLVSVVNKGLCERGNREPAYELCDWLVSAYEMLAICKLIEPGSSLCVIARSILNGTADDSPERAPARIDETGLIVFAEASRIRAEFRDGRFGVKPESYTPFFANMALQAGFRRILSALEQAKQMHYRARACGIDLEERSAEVVALIRALHAARPGRFATGPDILAFDFKRHVIDFVRGDKLSALGTVM